VPALESLESRLLLSVVDFTGKDAASMTYTDADGGVVTVTIKGGGTGQLTFQDLYQTDEEGNVLFDEETGLPQMDLITNNANPFLTINGATARTTVTITVKGAATTTIYGLSIDGAGLKAINAPKVNISGYDTQELSPVQGDEILAPVFGDEILEEVPRPTYSWDEEANDGEGGYVPDDDGEWVQNDEEEWVNKDSIGGLWVGTGEFEIVGYEGTGTYEEYYVLGDLVPTDAEMLIANAAAAAITLGDLANVEMNLNGVGTAKVTNLKVGMAVDSTINASPLPLAFSATDVNGVSLTALWFSKISVSGNMVGASVEALGSDTKGVSIGTMTVGRELQSMITAPGSIKSLTAGAITSDVELVESVVVYSTTFTADSIGTLTVKGYRIGAESFPGHMMASLVLAGSAVAAGKNALNTVKTSGNLSGSIVANAGSVGTVTVGGELTYFTLNVRHGRFNRLTARDADKGEIRASNIGTLTFKGDVTDFFILALNMELTGSINKITVARGIWSVEGLGSYIGTNTQIKSLTVGAMGAGSFLQAGSIGTLRAKGYKDGTKVIGSLAGTIQLNGTGVAPGKNTLNTLKADLLRGTTDIAGNMGTVAVKDMANARLTVTGKVKSLKTNTAMTQTGEGTASISVTNGGKFVLGTGKGKLTVKTTESVALYTIV